MKKLILYFLLFLAAVRGFELISLPTLIVGIGLVMAILSALHIVVTPENY